MKFVKTLKSLQAEAAEAGISSLKRSLGSWQLISLGIGAVIGAGLFSLTGIVAAENAGPAVMLSFVFAAFVCVLVGLCYAELASMIPIAGSAYTYAYATMGEFMAWIIGWDLLLEYMLTASTVAVSWSHYFVSFLHSFGFALPPRLMASPFESVLLADGATTAMGLINLPAIFIVALLSMVLIRGTQGSSVVNTILVIVKVSIVVIFIAVGFNYITPSNHEPFIPANTSGEFGKFGWSGILRGAAILFFAFVGFDAISTAAQETKNPKRNMPIGIIGSLVVCTLLYVGFSYVMTGLAPYTTFAGSGAPVVIAIAQTPFPWLGQIVTVAILFGYSSVMLVMLLAQSRIFYSMSKDGLVPPIFGKVHPKFRTPYQNNLIFGFCTATLAGLVPIADLGHMVSIGTLFAFLLVCVSVLIMRHKNPDASRAFKTPWVPLVPLLGIASCIGLMYFLPLATWERLAIWMALGFIIYFGYSRHHSKLRLVVKEKK